MIVNNSCTVTITKKFIINKPGTLHYSPGLFYYGKYSDKIVKVFSNIDQFMAKLVTLFVSVMTRIFMVSYGVIFMISYGVT